jgi:hypothetical protein|uniref:Uncharacterized protein n=1 Tax=Myoviridae sp. ctshb19 TaxID=2825194 RepID=A0A8S5UGT5_9CAUD|nr:MAG TPA: hypothetical protein [Myoviridae sp. ctshb19]
MSNEILSGLAHLAPAVLNGISAAVLRKLPNGGAEEIIIETDNDADYIRQVRDEYVMQDDDITVYVKQ